MSDTPSDHDDHPGTHASSETKVVEASNARHENNAETVEALAVGERPDLGHERDALIEALSGSGMGSDTRAGSLRGGSASGSEIDPDQATIDAALTAHGRASAQPRPPASVDPSDVKNTGIEPGEPVSVHDIGTASG